MSSEVYPKLWSYIRLILSQVANEKTHTLTELADEVDWQSAMRGMGEKTGTGRIKNSFDVEAGDNYCHLIRYDHLFC